MGESSLVQSLPLLGEPFAVELANTLYEDGSTVIDFLSGGIADIWLGKMLPGESLEGSLHLGPRERARLRDVRDATRLLLQEVAGGTSAHARDEAASVLERESSRASGHLALDWLEGPASWSIRYEGSVEDVLAAEIAGRCILFVGSSELRRVRQCARAGCSMLFVQLHRRRRFCHESCAHRLRQARYQQGKTQNLG